MPRILSHSLAAALLMSVPAFPAGDPAPPPAPLSLLKQIDQGFVQVFEKVAPTVVVIDAVKKSEGDDESGIHRFENFFQDRDGADKNTDRDRLRPLHDSHSEGSGFIIRPDGFIVTNIHVVAGADRIEVRLKDRRHFLAKLVGTDEMTDIALIKIDAKDLPAVEFGDSDALKIGQLVCAIGAPYNQHYSFTCGWVSGKGRTNLLGQSSKNILFEDYIQTDASINPGNSGGPLFDVDGKIVGMNTLINGLGRGLAFAIPSSMLQDVSKQLIADGKMRRSYIGVRVESLADRPAMREYLKVLDSGVYVHTIEADSPAFKSDLRPTDVITHVDGAAILVPTDLPREIMRKKVGQVVQLSVWRAGRTMTIPVTTGEPPGPFTKVSTAIGPKAVPNAETLGLKLKGVEGRVTVAELAPDGPAAKAGLRVDDVITDVESKAMGSPVAVFEAITAGVAKDGAKGVLLNVERKGKRTFVMLEPGG